MFYSSDNLILSTWQSPTPALIFDVKFIGYRHMVKMTLKNSHCSLLYGILLHMNFWWLALNIKLTLWNDDITWQQGTNKIMTQTYIFYIRGCNINMNSLPDFFMCWITRPFHRSKEFYSITIGVKINPVHTNLFF